MGGYSTIKQKVGTCQDCGNNSYLTAGRCRSCYWQHRAKVNSKKPAAVARQERKQDLTPWFNMQLTMCPERCENVTCQEPLRESMVINPRAVVAHILPKRTFTEVATHPLNRAFLCNKCHHKYDNGFADTMPELLNLCRSRLAHFIDQVAPDNFKSLPKYFSNEYTDH
jgi:hypothetical protein